MASGMHSQHVADLNYGGGAFKLAREGDTFVGISAASDLHPNLPQISIAMEVHSSWPMRVMP
jgi:hypothetical protein